MFPMATGLSLNFTLGQRQTVLKLPFNVSNSVNETVFNRTYALPMGFSPIPVHSTNKTKDPIMQPYTVCTNFYDLINSEGNSSYFA